jgi:integrase/recombinase XerD
MTAALAVSDDTLATVPHTIYLVSPVPATPVAALPDSGTGSGMDLGELLLADWARHMRAEGLSTRTVTEWPRIVLRAARWADADPTELTTDELADYLAALPSAATRQTYYSALRAWHRWLLATSCRADDPLAAIRRPRAPRGTPHPVATGHLEVLLASGIRRRTRTAILLAAYEGLRVHEIAKIRGEDVDLIGRRLRVVGKGGAERWMPLHPVIATEAHRYPRRGYWFPSPARPGRHVRRDSLSAVISRAMDRCGIPGTAHSLRHWFGTELLRSGANAREAQELLRHASLATTAIYTLVAADAQQAAIDRLPAVKLVSAT